MKITFMGLSKQGFLCKWRFANINTNFFLWFEQQNEFYKKRVCHITSPLPVGIILAHMAKFYSQNSDFYCLMILNCNILFSIY